LARGADVDWASDSVDPGETAGKTLDEHASKALLKRYGIAVPKSRVVPADLSIVHDLGELEPPLALKVIARGVVHKSDVGGVRLGLLDANAVQDAIEAIRGDRRIAAGAIVGYLLEEMAPKGHEIVVGGLLDPRFGPVIMAGLGGVFVEILKDVAFRACPITESDGYDMITGLKGADILAGARGGMRVGIAPLIEALVCIGGKGGLMMDLGPKLRELDVNPLIVSSDRAIAVDARVLLA
jgi:acetyl-CoA synthetase (ADP-forming)